ncbi:uncharacterized protein LOC142331085 [Lycorma delicatula]|uniref:uncharacterized protein LOC142331085 n=1 Tax=Lycorma delicatula TaxID=130591 RepID=UPI003F51A216
MDNPKKANQSKFKRNQKKKEYFQKNKNYDNEKSKEVKCKENIKSGPSQGPSVSGQGESSVPKADNSKKTEISEPPKINPANLKKETEEIANLNQKFTRRRIVSTWTRDFDIPKYPNDEDDDGADFNELISTSTSNFLVGNHFMLKEEREWLKKAESYDSPFSLDLKCLENGISCIPFHIRQGLSEKSFSPKEIQIMKNEAENNEVSYKETKDISSNETQKVTLNSPNKNDDIDFITGDTVMILSEKIKSTVNKISDSYKDNMSPEKTEIKTNGINKRHKIKESENKILENLTYQAEGNESRHNEFVDKFNISDSSSIHNSGVNNQSDDVSSLSPISVSSSTQSQTTPEYVSLEPRSQRVRNRDRHNQNNNTTSNSNMFVGSLSGLRKHSIVDEDLNVDKNDSSKFSSSSDFNEYSYNSDKSHSESVWSVSNEEIELDLKGLNKSNNSDNNNFDNAEKKEDKTNKDILNINTTETSIDLLSLNTDDKSNEIDGISLGSNLIKISNTINKKKVTTNNKKIDKEDEAIKIDETELDITSKNTTPDDEDDLDYLLGLKEPTSSSPLCSKKSISSSSNLLILQEKLKGTDVKNNTKKSSTIVKRENKSTKNSVSVPDEDLDEWLDSVLEN